MNQNLSYAWLARFEAFIWRTSERQVLVIIDNCSAHGKKEIIPELNDIRVQYLPPKTTSKIQPLDAGIIA